MIIITLLVCMTPILRIPRPFDLKKGIPKLSTPDDFGTIRAFGSALVLHLLDILNDKWYDIIVKITLNPRHPRGLTKKNLPFLV